MNTTAECEKLCDEVKELYSDEIKSMNSVKRSANSYSKRRRGKVHFSSDYLTSDELKALNGEVKTYQIGKPMCWAEFDILPNEIKRLYIKRLRDRYGATNSMIAEILGVETDTFVDHMKSNGILVLENRNRTPDLEAWNSFLNIVS